MTRKEAKILGLKSYESCCEAHGIIFRRVCNNACIECEKIRIKEQSKTEKRKASRKAYYASNKDKYKELIKDWATKNPERMKEAVKKYRAKNPDKMKEINARWIKNNPDKMRIRCAVRRAREKNAEGSFCENDITEILRKQLWKCVYCYADLTLGYQMDHILPLARGGSNWPSNLQATCQPCNSKKHAKTHDEFLEYKQKKGIKHVYIY